MWVVRRISRRAILLASLLLILPGRLAAEDRPAVRSRPAAGGDEIAALLRDLDHPSFQKRDAANDRLCRLQMEDLPALLEAYRSQGEHELKLRVRSVIEHIFYRKQLEGRVGFLGIRPKVEPNIYDPLTGRTIEAICAAWVLPDFPADKAGLKSGDLILEFDGKPIGDIMGAGGPQKRVARMINGRRFITAASPQIDAFTADVSQRDPGTPVLMRLLRCRPVDREITVAVAETPGETLDGARLMLVSVPNLQVVTNEMNGPPMRPGLCVTRVDPNSPAAARGLGVGDVIVGVDKTRFAGGTAPDQLAAALEKAGSVGTVKLTLSHLEPVRMTVTLGGRPVDRMNPQDMELAQIRFAEYWRNHTGECSLRSPIPTNWPTHTVKPAPALPDPALLP